MAAAAQGREEEVASHGGLACLWLVAKNLWCQPEKQKATKFVVETLKTETDPNWLESPPFPQVWPKHVLHTIHVPHMFYPIWQSPPTKHQRLATTHADDILSIRLQLPATHVGFRNFSGDVTHELSWTLVPTTQQGLSIPPTFPMDSMRMCVVCMDSNRDCFCCG